MHAKIINNKVEKFPYSFYELRMDNPNVSFPDIMEIDELPNLSEFGLVKVKPTPQPEYIFGEQKLSHGGLEFDGENWVEKWIIEPLSEEEINAIIQSQLKSASDVAKTLLKETDYIDLPNTANKIINIEEMVAYRDALRKIAINPELGISFPNKPVIVWTL